MLVPVTLVSGTVIFGSVWVATSSISFWTVESQEVANAFTYGGSWRRSTRSTCSRDWLRRLLTFVVPARLRRLLPGRPARSTSRAAARAAQRDRLGHARSSPSSPCSSARAVWRTRRPPPPEHRELT